MLGASRILEKGPGYLRKQMELQRGGNGRVSATERLAATKPNYVKTPQVTGSSPASTPEPVTGDTGSPCGPGPTEQSTPTSSTPTSSTPEQQEISVKRNSSKSRPDSVLLYRQKCDLRRGAPGANYRRKRTLLKSLRERNNVGAPVSAGPTADSSSDSDQGQECKNDGDKGKDNDNEGLVLRRRPERINLARRAIERGEGGGPESDRARKGVSRSHSDISSRYSKNFADFDAFFTYCGLESDVVETLGKDNFSSRSDERDLSYAKIRSVSVATSDGEISHTSGDADGLHEEEVKETRQQGSSVIERNARVIKWLYTCRNASQSGKMLRDLD
ncbi:protein FAM110C [Clarias gariepinus]|uniref:protein FAM110C n=1 Tax=Clarias gariepinus TaxID=13013 RepID=UPI00234CAB3B|nr:protein FAM110C [Clarias gariepinus]